MTYNLLPDQIALIQQAKDKVRAGCKSLLIQGATGSGKTVIAAEIISGAYRKEKICFFIVPRRDLLRQTSNTLREFGIYHSFIAAGMRCDTNAKIFVCSVQTLKNRMAILPDIAIIDETHYGGAGLDKIISRYKAAGVVILGLSATPWKLSGKGLGCWYSDMVCGPSIRWLIDNKRLSDYRLFSPDVPDLSGIRVVAGEYNNKQLSEKMESDRVLIGNSVKHYKEKASGLLGLTFGVSIKHSQILAEAYRDAGVPAMHMDGDTPDEERSKIIKAYAKRELKQLVNCDLLGMGFDLSSASGMSVTIESLTDCQPSMSLARQMQKNGRALRYKPNPALIFDHAGNVGRRLPSGEFETKHGFPCSERDWTLEDREKNVRDGKEKTIAVRQCLPDGDRPGCNFCHPPAPVCPNCGVPYTVQSRDIKEVEGELAEIEIHKQKMDEKKARAYQEWQCETLSDWLKLANERGHKTAWAIMRFKTMKPREKK